MIGKTLAHYEIIAKIGEGGMGEVYRARDTKLGRDVALKILPAHMASKGEGRRRFEMEARAIAALRHPNIVTIYAAEEADDVAFLTMELIEGENLATKIRPGGVDIASFLVIAESLADTVAAAHAKGITHRDLKPSNVMVGRGHLARGRRVSLSSRTGRRPRLVLCSWPPRFEKARTVEHVENSKRF
jgi:serine/threonine protein kinase